MWFQGFDFEALYNRQVCGVCDCIIARCVWEMCTLYSLQVRERVCTCGQLCVYMCLRERERVCDCGQFCVCERDIVFEASFVCEREFCLRPVLCVRECFACCQFCVWESVLLVASSVCERVFCLWPVLCVWERESFAWGQFCVCERERERNVFVPHSYERECLYLWLSTTDWSL
jgi:hypothetical protein